MKRMTAWILALVMLISPVSASAVTWGEVSAALKSSGSYNKDGVSAKTEDNTTTISGGSIENVDIGWNDDFADVMTFIFQGTSITGEFSMVSRDGAQYMVTVDEDTTINVERFNIDAMDEGVIVLENKGNVASTDLMFTEAYRGGEVLILNAGSMTAADDWHVLVDERAWADEPKEGVSSSVAVINQGTITGELHGAVEDAASLMIQNDNTIDGKVTMQGYGNSNAILLNNGTVTDDVKIQAWENSTVTGLNRGTLEQEFRATTGGEGQAQIINGGTVHAGFGTHSMDKSQINSMNLGVAGGYYIHAGDQSKQDMANYREVDSQMFAEGSDDSVISVINIGKVGEDLLAFTDSKMTLMNMGEIGTEIYAYVGKDAAMELTNMGKAEDRLHIVVNEGSQLKISNVGSYAEQMNVFFDALPTEEPNASLEKIYEMGSQLVGAIDVNGLTSEQVDGIVSRFNGSGYSDAYRIALGEDGKLYLVLIEEQAQEELPEKITRERYEHRMEEKRKEESIAGVYASPYWCRQLSLGYMNQNLWIHNSEGEKVNFREKLAWLGDGTPGKRLNLRVNLEDLTGVTMRLDGTVFATLERAEIAQLTIQDKDGNVYMDYAVSELKAAREMYGLASEELLVVGGANDQVMKVGADGMLVSVEE